MRDWRDALTTGWETNDTHLAPYNFGIYHWRRRGRTLLLGVLAVLVGAVTAQCGIKAVRRALTPLLRTPPWYVDTETSARFAASLPLSDADRVLDVGCGTGRSLVGLAPHLPNGASVVGLDVFDDRVVHGNTPKRVRRNTALAGLDITPVRGDATRLPVADGTLDLVTACRVLHDLSAPAARDTLADAYRACRPGGALGVLALPLPHEETAHPTAYWRDLVTDAGFDVEHAARFERCGRTYAIVVGTAAKN